MKKKGTHSIGTEHESSLHRALKFRYAGPEGRTEAESGGFVADGISAEGEFIEVQTGSFAPLRRKAAALAACGGLRIVYPAPVSKYIEVYDLADNGAEQLRSRRKSPRRGSQWDVFKALVYAPELPLIPGVCIEIALVDVTEKRVNDGKGSWRRKGLSITDREITAWHERICLERPSDYARFIPFEPDEEFTAPMLAKKAGIRPNLARKTLYVLTKMGLVERTGKKRTMWVYKKV